MKATGTWRGLPREVWALGLVSLCMDLSSEMIHSLLPLFLAGTLAASTATIGLIEGLAEATASIAKVFSGWLSDRFGRRKLLTVIGYGLAALSKPLFPLASAAGAVLAARLMDRLGKGIRGAPRDALIADVTPVESRGHAFGVRQALDTVGAVAGPLAAIGLMALMQGRLRAVLWWALIPAALAVLLLVIAVREPAGLQPRRTPFPIRRTAIGSLGRGFWTVTGLGAAFSLARFSEAFLILRARDDGLPLVFTPMVLVLMNLVYAVIAGPAGKLSDRTDRRSLLFDGLVVLVSADLVLAWWPSRAGACLGAALWGLHLGLTQGLFSALVADTAPGPLRGTGFGLFNLIGGLATLAASVAAGLLWQAFGAAAAFEAGAAVAALTLLMMLLLRPDRSRA